MGLFDYVKCDVPLPDSFVGELQTKDFDYPYLERYTITAEGRLFKRVVDFQEPAPESEWQHVGATDPLHKLWHEHSKIKIHWKEEDQNFHGVLNFYGGDSEENWHEYNAKFTDGTLVQIEEEDKGVSRAALEGGE